LHYDKREILEAYLNEVFVGQDGQRAVHGFGLASQFFFSQPLSELKLHQIALLVGMVKGPSYYNPRRYPDRALARRNLVLDLVAEQ
ncbi:transglycosylase domain-containing protein, partial [Pseudoalteromonas sp. SIMBA_162]